MISKDLFVEMIALKKHLAKRIQTQVNYMTT